MVYSKSLGLIGILTFGVLSASAAPTWRARTDLNAALNDPNSWAGNPNETVTIYADQPFRLRFEWERPKAYLPGMAGVILQYRRNGDDDWIEIGAYDFPYPKGEEPRSPRISSVHSPAYMHGEPTIDLLSGSNLPFAGGSGVNLAAAAPTWSERGGHMELEWALVARRWLDGAKTNEQGDLFDIRLADSTGKPLTGASVASFQLAIRDGHLGGTFVETPGRIGPWEASNGDLYFIMEPAESSNLFMMLKSEDGGRTWHEVDGENRPQTDDLESVDGRLLDGTIEIIHQVTQTAFRHAFNTSDHPSAPDQWAVTDEAVAHERSIAQGASLVVRSDGSMVAFYVGESLRYSIRSVDGEWGPSHLVESGAAAVLAGPQAVLGSADTTHLAYFRGDGTLWYRSLDKDNSLGEAVPIAEGVGTGRDAFGSILPLAYLPASDTLVIAYQLSDLRLWERRIQAAGKPTRATAITQRPVVREAADSQQPGADLIVVGDSLHVLFIDDETGELYSTSDQQGWGPAVLRVADVRADWVRGTSYPSPLSGYILRYIYDAGSGGGAGMNRYGEFAIGLE
ncbi:hypothetical protein [Pelagicoccus sp. SDUM812002]|uniref:hypothetical protein n=1 Tax=Pelagicoccus sp. SDUM812002 TaxID=3041266 RepID=UPI0028104AC6|nr:hypothetical protein [Pelagicoccus sp. SDUM812002]MDQ8188023.1 hypothetical protein [Pelagicoccus sp. SDUM812002]